MARTLMVLLLSHCPKCSCHLCLQDTTACCTCACRIQLSAAPCTRQTAQGTSTTEKEVMIGATYAQLKRSLRARLRVLDLLADHEQELDQVRKGGRLVGARDHVRVAPRVAAAQRTPLKCQRLGSQALWPMCGAPRSQLIWPHAAGAAGRQASDALHTCSACAQAHSACTAAAWLRDGTAASRGHGLLYTELAHLRR